MQCNAMPYDPQTTKIPLVANNVSISSKLEQWHRTLDHK
jgi:hypothetical protein